MGLVIKRSCTGKIDGIVYDHFGDFEAFILETPEGEHRRFQSRETQVLRLVKTAWAERILTTVISDHDDPDRQTCGGLYRLHCDDDRVASNQTLPTFTQS